MLLSSSFRWSSSSEPDRTFGAPRAPRTWGSTWSLGYTHTLGEAVTLNIGAGYVQRVLFRGGLPGNRAELGSRIELGSVQTIANRLQPLIRIHLGDLASLDVRVSAQYDFSTRSFEETYMFGTTFIW